MLSGEPQQEESLQWPTADAQELCQFGPLQEKATLPLQQFN